MSKSFFDLSIRNNTQEKQLEYLPLMAVDNLLICSKDYARENQLFELKDLNDRHCFIVRHGQRSKSWQSLLAQQPLSFESHANKQVISNSFGMLAAVETGLGVAVLPTYFVYSHIQGKTLDNIQVISSSMTATEYYLAYQDSFMARSWAARIKKVIIDNTSLDFPVND